MPAQSVWSALASRWEELFPLQSSRLEMCRRLTSQAGSVLDAGCGTGSLVRALLAADRDAWGFDLDPMFVEEAHQRLGTHAAHVVQGDLRGIDGVFAGRSFDLVVCLGQTFPHLLKDADVLAFLSGARSRLAPGGRLLIQVVSDENVPMERRLPTLEIEGLRLDRRRVLASADRAHLELRVSSSAGFASWTVEHRRWTPGSLSEAASDAGLRTMQTWIDESGAAWNGAGAGWILELERA